MNKATQLRYNMESLCIYQFKTDPVMRSLLHLLRSIEAGEAVLEAQSAFFSTLAPRDTLRRYISKLILTDDNVFSKAAAGDAADRLRPAILDGVKSDLAKLEAIADLTPEDILHAVENKDLREVLGTLPRWENGEALPPLSQNWAEQTEALAAFHKRNGYGLFANYAAFEWRDHALSPISTTDPIRLSDLKNYELQRSQVVDNTESFVCGLPANNVLLYGDRGTGKSSTIHAILNAYKEQGLRMIEIPKSAVEELSLIREYLADSPMKFIIYIDDLSFDSQNNAFTELKAALEGGLSACQPNTLIYATSNRRHLIREKFSDKRELDDELHNNDTVQEKLSLYARFGVTIYYGAPDKKEFQKIVTTLAEKYGVRMVQEELLLEANKWELAHGGLSGRTAQQFINYMLGQEV